MNIKNFVLGIAIFILTVSVGIYGISTFIGKAPDYRDFCKYDRPISTQEECLTVNGTWINSSQQAVVEGIKAVPAMNGYCDLNKYYEECNKELENAQEKHGRKVFLTALPLGIIVIIIGAVIFGLVAVGGGLMAGGVGIIIYGVGGFWRFADDWIKFLLSLAGLIILIGLAYYINKKWVKK